MPILTPLWIEEPGLLSSDSPGATVSECRNWRMDNRAARWDRKPLPRLRDYRGANGAGTRGIMSLFMLLPRRVYEVCESDRHVACDRYLRSADVPRFENDVAANEWLIAQRPAPLTGVEID